MKCSLCGRMLWPWQEWTNWVHRMKVDPTGYFYDREIVHLYCGKRHIQRAQQK